MSCHATACERFSMLRVLSFHAVQKGALKARAAIARALCDEIFVVWPRT